MVTSNALKRTFFFQYGDQAGTAFMIDVEGKQYLITAAHIINGNTRKNARPQVMNAEELFDISCSLIGMIEDVAVFFMEKSLDFGNLTLPATLDGLFLSQDVYFLGFPYGFRCNVKEDANANYPLPYVKKGCLAKIATPDLNFMIIDGHNNPGFSGGPVIYSNGNNNFVAGIVSGYIRQIEPQPKSPQEIWANTGLIKAYSINHALDLIKGNTMPTHQQ